MTKARMLAVGLAAVLAFSGVASAESETPEEAVTQYLAAMKGREFGDAYKHISKGMAGNKDVEAWSKEYKYLYEATDLKIFKFEVFPGKIDGEKAQVPNILSSQDKFLNQLGADEYELYTLIKEEGAWKIDQQEIVEKGDQSPWFTRKGG